jgi:hypothetical protein
VPAKPPQIDLKRANNGIRRVSTVFTLPFLPPSLAWTGIPKHTTALYCSGLQEALTRWQSCVDKQSSSETNLCQQRRRSPLPAPLRSFPYCRNCSAKPLCAA